MRIRKFEAPDMDRALRRVRETMGPQAVIVSTRTVRKEGGLFGLLGRKVLEVTAAVEETRRAGALGEPEGPEPRETRPQAGSEVQETVGSVLEEVRALRDRVGELDQRLREGPPDLRPDLERIRDLVGQLVGEGRLPADEEGAATQRLVHFLVTRGVEESLSRDLVKRVLQRVDVGAVADLDRLKLNLAAEMRADLARAGRGAPPARTQIFVGPSGVGKTTTVAKLAARAARSGASDVRIVTTDALRPGSLEQMAALGAAVGVTVAAAHGAGPLGEARADFANAEHVFIDTAGGSYRDRSAVEEIEALSEVAGDVEILLCLAATTRPCDVREVLEAYAPLAWSRLVITKLDETDVYGGLYNCVVLSGRPVACVTTGATVPGNLESLGIAGVLRRVLHGPDPRADLLDPSGEASLD
jgi:flagellar biosynthesis protein FlhF